MYKRILIVVDARAGSQSAVHEGVGLAAALGAELLFFHPLPRYTAPLSDLAPAVLVSPEQFGESAQLKAGTLLDAAQKVADKACVRCTCASAIGDDDAHAVVDAAMQHRCGLIVVASEDRNAVLRLLTGSIIPGLVTASTLPVLVVKPGAS